MTETKAERDAATALRVMKEHSLPPVPSAVKKLQWIMGRGDWWALTDDGWYWLGPTAPHNKKWQKSNFGPG